MTLQVLEDRDHVTRRDGWFTMSSPPITELIINLHVVLLCRCRSLSKSVGDIGAIDSLAFQGTEQDEDREVSKIRSSCVRMSEHAHLTTSSRAVTNSTGFLSVTFVLHNLLNPGPVEDNKARWQRTWWTIHALCIILILLFLCGFLSFVPIRLFLEETPR